MPKIVIFSKSGGRIEQALLPGDEVYLLDDSGHTPPTARNKEEALRMSGLSLSALLEATQGLTMPLGIRSSVLANIMTFFRQ